MEYGAIKWQPHNFANKESIGNTKRLDIILTRKCQFSAMVIVLLPYVSKCSGIFCCKMVISNMVNGMRYAKLLNAMES